MEIKRVTTSTSTRSRFLPDKNSVLDYSYPDTFSIRSRQVMTSFTLLPVCCQGLWQFVADTYQERIENVLGMRWATRLTSIMCALCILLLSSAKVDKGFHWQHQRVSVVSH
jgi:hypothetical protein